MYNKLELAQSSLNCGFQSLVLFSNIRSLQPRTNGKRLQST